TQPALFVVEVALARLWMSWGVQPQAMLGHSIGEWVAAHLAGVVTLDDALDLVAARGRLMAQQPGGVMLALSLPRAEAEDLLAGHGELALAALNEPQRVVVAGPATAVEALEAELAARRVSCRRLHTSHAFHSPLMDGAVEPFVEAVQRVRLQPPEIPFLSNVTGTWITAEEATDPSYWGRQLRQPVRFADGVGALFEEPRRVCLEVGPGRTLSTLVGRHDAYDGQVAVPSLPGPRDETGDLPTLLGGLGRLWLAGLELDPALFFAGEERQRIALPSYPFAGQRYWIEPGEAPQRSAEQDSPAKAEDLADWFYLPSWKKTLPPQAAGESAVQMVGEVVDAAPPWLVFGDDRGFATALESGLRSSERRAITVTPGTGFQRVGDAAYVIDPTRREDYEALFEALGESGEVPRRIVHAWSLCPGRPEPAPPAVDAAQFEAAQKLGFYSLLWLGRALATRSLGGVDLSVVSNRLVALTTGEGVQPEKATLLGLLRVLPQELPGLTVRCLDLEAGRRPAEQLADLVLREVDGRSADAVVVYRGGERWIESFEPVRVEPPRAEQGTLRRGGHYLVTGGLVGDGLALSRLLARVAGARLSLLESAPAPGFTEDTGAAMQRERIAEIESLGGQAQVLTADLSDAVQVGTAVAEAERRFGALHGVIHAAAAAGEESFQMLHDTDLAACARHFAPKIHGLYALAEALAGRRLETRILLASLASTLGGLGSAAYAAANAVLDAHAVAGSGA
ncbi:MAG: SDR family oxidoreductase, partial [Acidobacteriota bacterium]